MFQIFVIAVQRRSSKAHGHAIVVLLRRAVRLFLKGAGISFQQSPAPIKQGGLVFFVAVNPLLGVPAFSLCVVVLLALSLAFVLHPPVLEPDFDLSLGQVQQSRYFHPPRPAKVLVEVELLFQLQQLGVCIRCPQPTGAASSSPGALHNLRRT